MPLGYRLGSAQPQCPYLYFLVYHTVRRSLLGRDAVRRPRPSTRAPREIFCCKPASVRMQRLAIGGGGTIGIVTYSDWARNFAAMRLGRLWRDQGKPQQGRELLAPPPQPPCRRQHLPKPKLPFFRSICTSLALAIAEPPGRIAPAPISAAEP